MIDTTEFLTIIKDFINYHKLDDNITMEISRWGSNHDITIYEAADILGSIPDMFTRIKVAKELTQSLYSSERFMEQLHRFAENVYTGNL